MTPDPKRSPIAALAKKWRESERVYREQAAGQHELNRGYYLKLATSAAEIAEELEAAIAAQVEYWEDDSNGQDEYAEQWLLDLKGEQ